MITRPIIAGAPLLAILGLLGCSSEPAAVKNAYTLMDKRLCAEAIAPLQAALVEHPDNRTIPQALCRAALCAATLDGKPDQMPARETVTKYCEQGFGEATSASEAVMRAFALTALERDDNAADYLDKADAKYGSDSTFAWFHAYDFSVGQHRASGKETEYRRIPVTAKSLGEIVQSVDPCLAAPKDAAQALVKRTGAGIFVPGESQPENTFKAGGTFPILRVGGDRVVFNDGLHEHWRPSTGWIPEASSIIDWQSPTGRVRLTVPLDPQYVFRDLPDIGYWDALKANAPCSSYNGQNVLSCSSAGKIPMRPGTLKHGGATQTRERRTSFPDPTQTFRTTYRQVSFEERVTPEREVRLSDVYPITKQCNASGWQYLLSDFPEWDDGVIEAALQGEVRKGMPALLLAPLGFRAKETLFDRDGVIVIWHSPKGVEVKVRDGRVW